MIDSGSPRRRAWLWPLAVASVVVGCYFPIFSLPHVLDDWGTLFHLSQGPDAAEVLRYAFVPREEIFFRPASRLYHVASYHGFGTDATGFHLLAMVWLTAAALLVAKLAHELTRDASVGLATGLLYASATSIHMDPMLFEAGINDLGAACLAWLALWLSATGRRGSAAAAFAGALCFKEAAAFVPIVAAGLVWLRTEAPPRAVLRRVVGETWAMIAVVAAWASIKLAINASALALDATHPYALGWGGELVAGARVYFGWMIGALVPLVAETKFVSRGMPALADWAWLPLLAGALAIGSAAIRRAYSPRLAILLVVWIAAALAPVIALPNHRYRYYLVYCLPPALLFFLAVVRASLEPLRGRARGAFGVVVLVLVIGGGGYFHRRAAEGVRQRYVDGTNALIRRGTLVRIVRDGLERLRPRLPTESILVFEGVDLESFRVTAGPRLWTADPTLEVVEWNDVRRQRRGAWMVVSPPPRPIHLAPDRTFAFRLEHETLRDATGELLAELAK